MIRRFLLFVTIAALVILFVAYHAGYSAGERAQVRASAQQCVLNVAGTACE